MRKIILSSLSVLSFFLFPNEGFDTIKPSVAILEMNGVKMSVSLENLEGNKWKIESVINAGAGIFSRKEKALFTIDKNAVTPFSWSRKERMLFSKKDYLVSFNWDKSEINFKEDNVTGKLDLLPGYLGPATAPLVIRLKLRELGLEKLPKELINYVYFKGEIKERTYTIGKLENILTPMGEFQAIRVDRVRSDLDPREQTFWFAPLLDFILIKVINDDGKEKRELMISSYEELY
jgi:hypothetical protein